MIAAVLSILLTLIFFTLCIIHFNWAIGGRYGFSASLPTTESGKKVLNPKKIDSAVVGVGLTLFGLYYVFVSEITNQILPDWVVDYGGWIIPSIFMLRAIGDFKYIGFFKHIKQTDFARRDSKLFSPLCLLIAVIGITIRLYKMYV